MLSVLDQHVSVGLSKQDALISAIVRKGPKAPAKTHLISGLTRTKNSLFHDSSAKLVSFMHYQRIIQLEFHLDYGTWMYFEIIGSPGTSGTGDGYLSAILKLF